MDRAKLPMWNGEEHSVRWVRGAAAERARIRREIEPYLEKAKAQRIEDPVTWELVYRLELALGGEDA